MNLEYQILTKEDTHSWEKEKEGSPKGTLSSKDTDCLVKQFATRKDTRKPSLRYKPALFSNFRRAKSRGDIT